MATYRSGTNGKITAHPSGSGRSAREYRADERQVVASIFAFAGTNNILAANL
jgi:hypothetical protein